MYCPLSTPSSLPWLSSFPFNGKGAHGKRGHGKRGTRKEGEMRDPGKVVREMGERHLKGGTIKWTWDPGNGCGTQRSMFTGPS